MKINNSSNIGFGSNVKLIYKDGFNYLYHSGTVSKQLNKIKNDKMNYAVTLEPISGSSTEPEGIYVRIMDSAKKFYSSKLASSREVLYNDGILKAYEHLSEVLNNKSSLWKKPVPEDLPIKDYLI